MSKGALIAKMARSRRHATLIRHDPGVVHEPVGVQLKAPACADVLSRSAANTSTKFTPSRARDTVTWDWYPRLCIQPSATGVPRLTSAGTAREVMYGASIGNAGLSSVIRLSVVDVTRIVPVYNPGSPGSGIVNEYDPLVAPVEIPACSTVVAPGLTISSSLKVRCPDGRLCAQLMRWMDPTATEPSAGDVTVR